MFAHNTKRVLTTSIHGADMAWLISNSTTISQIPSRDAIPHQMVSLFNSQHLTLVNTAWQARLNDRDIHRWFTNIESYPPYH